MGLAFAKGQLGDTINWIGATLSIESSKVLAITIVKSRLDELRELCAAMRNGNTVSVAKLRTFTGKCQSMASILYIWRPFVHMLYGALYASDPSNCRPGLIWTKQIQIPLDWISIFLQEHGGDLIRTMNTDSHFRRGVKIEITTDASPYGIGGFICIDGQPVEYFAAPADANDANVVGVPYAQDSKRQQAFEALALLLALRHWRYRWARASNAC